MIGSSIDEAKIWIKYYYNNGVWEENPNYKVSGLPATSDVIEFVGNFLHFLLDTTFLTPATKMWLTTSMPSVRVMVEAHNEQCLEIDKLNFYTTKSNITNDKTKVTKYLGEDMLYNVMHNPEKYMEEAINKLDILQRKYMKDTVYNKSMVIKIPKNYICKEVDDMTWLKLTQLLSMYSKKNIQKIEEGNDKSITNEVFGYYNYLISGTRLSDKDKQRLSEIKMILGI